ncbi:30S ribosomal protein S4 [Candidatus Peregrinibacteria bacterium]|nr:30S ribosomal protein S4 [Candidatus Peregrinibacteria bacterium]
MRFLGPKAKLCRKYRANLFGTAKYTKILEKRPGKPGQHGSKTKFGKLSEFGSQLFEKNKARFLFGISERQFKNYVLKAQQTKGETGDTLLRMLEMRLDNVIYISQFAVTRVQARQMVSHGHFMLNGRRVDVPSIQVRPGDKIEIRPKVKTSPLYAGLDKLKDFAPKWVKVDLKKISLEVLASPEKDELEKSVDIQAIVEFYSR